jgi:hypothetical protein
MVRANPRSSIAKDGDRSNCRGAGRAEPRFRRTFPVYSDPLSDLEYLTELAYALDPDGSPPCLDWGKLARARPKPTRGASEADRAGIFAPRATSRRLPALGGGVSTGPQGLNARGFWLPFRPIHMHFIGHSPDDPEPDSRKRTRPLMHIPC